MLTAALAAALAPALVAHTPALAQSADTKHPRVIEVRPAEGATGVSPTSGEFSEGHKVVAFFSEDMKPGQETGKPDARPRVRCSPPRGAT